MNRSEGFGREVEMQEVHHLGFKPLLPAQRNHLGRQSTATTSRPLSWKYALS
jgi:hypothetical protein